MEKSQLRLLIITRGLATLRAHYEDVIVALARAGVQVSIRYGTTNDLGPDDYQETLLRRGCSVRLNPLPADRRTRSDLLGLRLRQLANLLRFSHTDYRGREWLRDAKFERAAKQ